MSTRRLLPALAGLLIALPLAAPADPPPWAPAHGWRAKHDGDDDYECEYRYKEKKGRYEYEEKCKSRGKHKRKHKRKHRDDREYERVDYDVERYEDYGKAVGIPSGSCHKEVVGGLVGAAAGGFLGSKVGKGDGQLAATAAGTVLGYIVGSSVGRHMDAVDQNCVGQVLERASDRQTVAWTDDASDSRYEVTPMRTYRDEGRYCRDYVMDALVDGRPQSVTGTACRNPDGTWTRG